MTTDQLLSMGVGGNRPDSSRINVLCQSYAAHEKGTMGAPTHLVFVLCKFCPSKLNLPHSTRSPMTFSLVSWKSVGFMLERFDPISTTRHTGKRASRNSLWTEVTQAEDQSQTCACCGRLNMSASDVDDVTHAG